MASFDDYIKMYERINQQFISIISPCIDSLSPETMEALNTLNRMSYSPIQEWAESYASILAPIQKMCDNLTNGSAASIAAAIQNPTILAAGLQEIIPPDISWRFENLDAFFAKQFSAAFDPLISDNNTCESDYVIVNEKPIKKICVPDNLTIPIGNYRIKIGTGHFITIVFGVLTLVATFITSIPSLNVDQMQEERLCIKAQQWQNQILEQLFESIDTSFSTQTDIINSFIEAQIKAAQKQEEAAEAQIKTARKQEEAAEAQIKASQAQEKAAQAFEEAADSFREASDSVKEPEYIEPHK